MNRTNVFSAIVALLVLSATGWIVVNWWPASSDEIGDSSTDQSATTIEEPAAPLVVLTDAKAIVAGIRTQPVTRSSIALTRTLPARFAYDDRRHVAVRAATDSIIESVAVKPGDRVEVGAVVAILRSPAIGEARGMVLKREAELELAETKQKWNADICDGVKELVWEIRAGKPVETIETDVNDSTLGKYRGQLLAAYSQAKLATQLSGSASSSSGAVSGRVIRERQSQQQQARATLDALIEQSVFETQQACKTATADAEAARRSAMVARQKLATALGISGEKASAQTVSPGETDLARLEVRSPLAGTVEERHFAATERVTAGAEMFIIADTSVLWIEADVRGRDWSAMKVSEGDRVIVTTSNQPNEQYQGKVHYVGRRVDSASGAIPLVVEISNADNQFRPGLFARVEVPTDVIDDTISVPASAVIDLDGKASVFVGSREGYQPVAVEVGVSSGGRIEILGGLSEGVKVVTRGAFLLKSELLLEGEE
ncbi:efflux RND transporter periplasmic adaptor subunit [Planctomycetes bacterium K23_9]|uniref:Cobalt-zinc-cadmium resistance protein CzcB n=1 Tax=Stieleria marina TaxID=1930275 RepID=A0A517NNL8_9BACT|nr:Cobalt-zinc-cadmium resistance protein CzcB [Planctomycetes bacterium K23_9]